MTTKQFWGALISQSLMEGSTATGGRQDHPARRLRQAPTAPPQETPPSTRNFDADARTRGRHTVDPKTGLLLIRNY